MGRGLELSDKLAVFFSLPFDRHVAEDGNFPFGSQTQIKGSFCFRLIDTREYFACMMAFELGRELFFLYAIGLIVAWVEAVHTVSDNPRKTNDRDVHAGWQIVEVKFQFVVFMLRPGCFTTVDLGCFNS